MRGWDLTLHLDVDVALSWHSATNDYGSWQLAAPVLAPLMACIHMQHELQSQNDGETSEFRVLTELG